MSWKVLFSKGVDNEIFATTPKGRRLGCPVFVGGTCRPDGVLRVRLRSRLAIETEKQLMWSWVQSLVETRYSHFARRSDSAYANSTIDVGVYLRPIAPAGSSPPHRNVADGRALPVGSNS